VRFDRLKNPKIDMIWVALAGPGSNFIQAIAWAILWFMPQLLGIDEPYLGAVAKAGVMWNISLLVFNLLPIPPMDGGRVLTGLLPYRQAVTFSRIEPWGFFIVLGLAISGLVSDWWMQPLSGFFLSIIRFLMWPLQHWL
jgi:Zn-dependent protease